MNLLQEITGLFADKLVSLKTIVSIVNLETKLAGLSIYPLLLNICMLLIVLMAMWSSSMLLLGYCAMLIFDSIVMSIFFIILLNSLFFLGLLKYLSFNLKQMSFEKTREYLFQKQSDQDEKSEKTNHCADRNERKNITKSAS